jgi:hypothetical protein
MPSNEELRKEPLSDYRKSTGVSGQEQGAHEGPVAGGADNTRGENKPSREGDSGGAKKGKSDPNSGDAGGVQSNPLA